MAFYNKYLKTYLFTPEISKVSYQLFKHLNTIVRTEGYEELCVRIFTSKKRNR